MTDFDPFYRPPVGTQKAMLSEAERAALPGAGEETPSFWDLLDVINPLQHLPVVGALYREVTGDTLSAPARVLGDALYGGPLGLIAGVADSIVEAANGEDIGGAVIASLFGKDGAPTDLAEAPPQTADATVADSDPEPEAAPAPPPAALQDRTDRRVLTGPEALRALAADLRQGAMTATAAPAPTDKAPTDEAGRPARATATTLPGSGHAPPAEAFMALAPRNFSGTLAQRDPLPSLPGSGPGQPSHADERRNVNYRSAAPTAAPPLSPAAIPTTASGPGTTASPFTAKMMEALIKYQALKEDES